MIKKTDILSMGYYGKGIFTGSDGQLRYRIEKYKDPDNGEAPPKFLVTTWKGPLAFDATPDNEKTHHFEEFSDDGLSKITDYLNNC